MLFTVPKDGRIDNLSERGAHLGTPLFLLCFCISHKYSLPCTRNFKKMCYEKMEYFFYDGDAASKSLDAVFLQ